MSSLFSLISQLESKYDHKIHDQPDSSHMDRIYQVYAPAISPRSGTV